MSRALADLTPEMREMCIRFLDACLRAGLAVQIVGTGRTREDQERYIKAGVSWTKDSLHLYGLAFDAAPAECLRLKMWAPDHPDWLCMGLIGESVGLDWGGRWKTHPDRPHFQAPAEMVAAFRRSQQGASKLA